MVRPASRLPELNTCSGPTRSSSSTGGTTTTTIRRPGGGRREPASLDGEVMSSHYAGASTSLASGSLIAEGRLAHFDGSLSQIDARSFDSMAVVDQRE